MLSCSCYTAICVFILGGIIYEKAESSPWANPSLELLDELNDAAIYKAVLNSMNEWTRKQNLKKNNARTKRQDSSQVCYPDLGCFSTSGPFGYLDMPPSKPEEIGTKFLFYPSHSRRRRGASTGEIAYNELDQAYKWAKDGFNSSLPTKVLIHGFGSDCTHVWVYEMRSALMAVEEANVICVDWENGAILPNYVKATANTRVVGKQLAMLLKGLVDNNGLSLKKTHLIGFSLGAHVAGFAGAELGNLSRITGLDPAGPLFESQDPRARLDQTDAEFVDVIHSNGENLILGGLGSYQPMGHVDFYPNGGRMQKGCSNIFVGAVTDIIWSTAIEGRSLCNHRRAYKFFTDSVSPKCHFPAFPCNSYEEFLAGKCFPCNEKRACGNMGYYADRSKGRGQLFLVTRDEEPFCAHQYYVRIESYPTKAPIVSYGKIHINLIGESGFNETFMMTKKEDEEMKLGQSISKIVVVHPILQEPTKIQIIYSAYSGWLSSGLTQWKIDRITLKDSFGKTSSVCKKNLVLESGVPVTLSLYPGECNIPKESSVDEAQDRVHDTKNNFFNYTVIDDSQDAEKFIPTPVVYMGDENVKNDSKNEASVSDSVQIINLPWKNEKENKVEEEVESSRAFNTRIVKVKDAVKEDNPEGIVREIVEPILKPHSSKNARSHDIDKEKPEITEPILRPTTSKTRNNFKQETQKDDILSKLTKNDKEIIYNFYELDDDDWVPSVRPLPKPEKVKREDETRVLTSVVNHEKVAEPPQDDNANLIAMTVQILPQRLARMFEQAEKYARETLLPFVSTYTPKFLSDFITPTPVSAHPKYLPLSFEQTTINSNATTTPTSKTTTTATTTINPTTALYNQTEFSVETTTKFDIETTTRYTHIQKISKKKENVALVFPLSTTPTIPTIAEASAKKLKTDGRNAKDVSAENLVNDASHLVETVVTSKELPPKVIPLVTMPEPNPTAIYIDLPVFEGKEDKVKYIPVSSFTESSKTK